MSKEISFKNKSVDNIESADDIESVDHIESVDDIESADEIESADDIESARTPSLKVYGDLGFFDETKVDE